ncbi:MAG TPA: S41 family peptidase [Acidobacteriota bacterium]|nr:S41 family peptidase [Acidobacteriota bacterium]
MLHKGKMLVFFCSALIVVYGVSAAFYGKVVAKDEAYKELSVFMDALKRINDDYVESPDMSKVQEGAMRGLLDALDPYSSFLTKEQFQALEKRRVSGTAGTGMIVSKRADVIYVVSTERDGAAAEAGVRPGDYLVAVDGDGVEEKSILEVESLLRGEPGTKVKLTAFRGSGTKPLEIEVTRKVDVSVPVTSKMLEGNVGLLDVPSLSDAALDQARTKLKSVISSGAEKIILDLRDCADGKTQDGADLANFFLKSGVIYYSQNRQGERVQEIQASPDKFITQLPMVVLINGSTAGPAEIAAGALKDQGRAVVVGEKSFGVGSSQRQIPLKSGAVLILSTAKYYTPAGKMIQDESVRNTGIKPDILAPDEERRQDLMVEAYYDDQDDAGKYRQLQDKIDKIQLDKALEVVSKSAAQPKKAA